MVKSLLRLLFWVVAAIPAVAVLIVLALACRLMPRPSDPRVMFGVDPIINNRYWAQSVPGSKTWVCEVYSINSATDFDFVLSEQWKPLPFALKYLVASGLSLLRFDVFCLSFNGGFLGRTPLAALEPWLFRLAGKRVVILAFGSDAYVYRKAHNAAVMHALNLSYPEHARRQREATQRVARWERHADIVVPSVMSADGLSRWDVLMPSSLFLDTGLWSPSRRMSGADGKNGAVIITHSPNHRGFKGTEFLIEAIRQLLANGLLVELRLIEGVKNDEVRRILREQSDIHVEQLIVSGHGMNGLEAMSSGLPTISNLEDPAFTEAMRRYSYLSECPLVSASPETVTDVLRDLVTNPTKRHGIGAAGRHYVETRHSIEAGQRFFSAILDKVWYGRDLNLLTMFHPGGEFAEEIARRNP